MSFSGLMVATPCYGGVVTNAYLMSVLRTASLLTARGIRHEVVTAPGDSLIARARNTLVSVFMASDNSHFMFIDADIEWQPEAIIRLLAADKDVICGAYPKKKLPVTYAINFKPGSDQKLRQCPKSGAIEIRDAATGFLMIKRRVFERMIAAYPQTRYVGTTSLTPEQDRFTHALFDCLIEVVDGEPRYLSEDFGFCRRWQAIGGEVWLDPAIKLNHHGPMAYEGDVSSIFVAEEAQCAPSGS